MLTTALPSPKSNFSSPYLFFGELKSGLFQLSSDLSRVLGVADEGPCRFDLVMRRLLADECDRVVLRAEMDAFVGISACSVHESACNDGECSSIKVYVED